MINIFNNKENSAVIAERAIDPYGYIMKGINFFFPRFKYPGRSIINKYELDGVVFSHEYSCNFKTNETHQKIVMEMLSHITDRHKFKINGIDSTKNDLDRFSWLDNEHFGRFQFDFEIIAKNIHDYKIQDRDIQEVKEKIKELGSIEMWLGVNGKERMFKWLWCKDINEEIIYVDISVVLLKYIYQKKALKFNRDRFKKLNYKYFRTALLIEETKIKEGYRPYIEQKLVIEALEPNLKNGKPKAIEDIQNKFDNASKVGYPLYVLGITIDDRFTWCNSELKNSQVKECIDRVSLYKKNGLYKRVLKNEI